MTWGGSSGGRSVALDNISDTGENEAATLYRDEVMENLARARNQIAIMDQWTAPLKSGLDKTGRDDSPSEVPWVADGVANLLRLDFGLEKWRKRLERALGPDMVRKAHLISGPSVQARPVEPRVPLVVAICSVFCVFGGIVVAFAAEFVAKARQTMRS
jgi:hypothetical protein